MSLVIDQISKRFGAVQALDGVSFTAEPGSIFGLLGANGAGKTTAMRIVLDILRADGGTVTWNGRANTDLPRRTWGYLPEERGLYLRMRVGEVLRFFASLYGVSETDANAEIGEWLDRFRIPEYRDRKVEELSKGNQQKIQFIASILHDPDVLIMDEPFTGLDPVNVGLLKEAFLAMRERGKTLIFSTHQMEQVEELCESIAIIDRGRVVVAGGVREVKRAMGRQVVRFATADAGDERWLEGLDGVRIGRRGEDYLELTVPAGTDPQLILQSAMQRGERVTRFEIGDPSLEEVFIAHVGRPAAEEEAHLAPGGER
ncbi:MAG TPA: ATP-binding cassette domain-containing protein [Candidatus Limnocylindria bacterium]|jgi:ABC-2 type transport system ATP-binding protein|nr:ATP-binding cassette domain-containing protein [Candidatus Limnocylindria bacterium]